MGKTPESYLSTKELMKATIRFVVYRHNRLTVKEIQQKTGLKRQTTYNYLNEMLEENLLKATHEPIPDRPNMTIAYYSLSKPKSYDKSSKYNQQLSDRFSNLQIPPEDRLKHINDGLDIRIAAMLEAKALLNQMSPEELETYLRRDKSKVTGFFSLVTTLSDEEYQVLYQEFEATFNRFWKEWRESDKPKPSRADIRNVFTFTFYRDFVS